MTLSDRYPSLTKRRRHEFSRPGYIRAIYPDNLCAICTSLKSIDPGLSFAADSMDLSSVAAIQRTLDNLYNIRLYVTVIQAHTNQKPIYDFLSVFRCNYTVSQKNRTATTNMK